MKRKYLYSLLLVKSPPLKTPCEHDVHTLMSSLCKAIVSSVFTIGKSRAVYYSQLFASEASRILVRGQSEDTGTCS